MAQAKKTTRKSPSRRPAKRLSYADAGVSIETGDAFIGKIAPLAKATRRPEVLAPLGGFGSLFAIPKGYRDPVLVSGTDGVGTKLKLAFEMNKHDTIGIDLVAMCVNDIVVQGAEPLFFLDYFSTGKLKPAIGTQVVKGIAKGCKLSGCALVGGETAEMPGMYAPGEYDLAGFSVGIAERKQLLPAKAMRAGDVVIGLASSGVHSNGFSLVRKIIETRGLSLKKPLRPGAKKTLGQYLLEPTKIYVPLALELHRKGLAKGFAHITGGGLIGNLPRVLPGSLKARVTRGAWPRSPLFEFLQEQGNVADAEMLKTFNCGVGFTIIAAEKDAPKILALCKAHKTPAWIIGDLARRKSGDEAFEITW
ncbi:MAG: phosphoribosylformylglycinamidine cyclo-ligase [Chrysiogenetes bacterium]|nr:phosphoribosylformylglycinamidine cyclo-ligase [Chrysiogenetes bacterium]